MNVDSATPSRTPCLHRPAPLAVAGGAGNDGRFLAVGAGEVPDRRGGDALHDGLIAILVAKAAPALARHRHVIGVGAGDVAEGHGIVFIVIEYRLGMSDAVGIARRNHVDVAFAGTGGDGNDRGKSSHHQQRLGQGGLRGSREDGDRRTVCGFTRRWRHGICWRFAQVMPDEPDTRPVTAHPPDCVRARQVG